MKFARNKSGQRNVVVDKDVDTGCSRPLCAFLGYMKYRNTFLLVFNNGLKIIFKCFWYVSSGESKNSFLRDRNRLGCVQNVIKQRISCVDFKMNTRKWNLNRRRFFINYRPDSKIAGLVEILFRQTFPNRKLVWQWHRFMTHLVPHLNEWENNRPLSIKWLKKTRSKRNQLPETAHRLPHSESWKFSFPFFFS